MSLYEHIYQTVPSQVEAHRVEWTIYEGNTFDKVVADRGDWEVIYPGGEREFMSEKEFMSKYEPVPLCRRDMLQDLKRMVASIEAFEKLRMAPFREARE